MQSDHCNKMAETHEPHLQHQVLAGNSSMTCSPLLFPLAQNYHLTTSEDHQIFNHIQAKPFTQQLFQYQNQVALQQQQHCYQEGQLLMGCNLPLSFKFGFNEKRNGKSYGVFGEGEEDALVHGSQQYGTASHISVSNMSHCWQTQEDSGIKQSAFWKPLSTEIGNVSKRWCNEEMTTENTKQDAEMNHFRPSSEDQLKSRTNKGRVFGELEAIYGGGALISDTNQNGSSSALTAEITSSKNATLSMVQKSNVSIGEEAAAAGVSSLRMEKKRKRRKRLKDELASVAHFFESLVRELMDHQEKLHMKFMQVVERLDEERKAREEAWRQGELERHERETSVRAHERALASSREVAIISYLEKIAGQSINFPSHVTSAETTHDDEDNASPIFN